MEGRLFGLTEKERQIQETAKAGALLACEVQRAKLKHCFRKSWFGWCIEEHKQFWDCYTRVGPFYIRVGPFYVTRGHYLIYKRWSILHQG